MDINSDMGEGFGPWEMGNDADLLNHITSTNIACGWHAGDPARMRWLVEQAIQKNVLIGAHLAYLTWQALAVVRWLSQKMMPITTFFIKQGPCKALPMQLDPNYTM